MSALSGYSHTPATLPAFSTLYGVLTSSLPSGAHVIYEDTSSCATVSAIPYGSGWVVLMAPSWWSADTTGDWSAALVASARS